MRTHLSLSTGRCAGLLVGVDPPHDVLEVEQAEDVVAIRRRRPGCGRTRTAGTATSPSAASSRRRWSPCRCGAPSPRARRCHRARRRSGSSPARPASITELSPARSTQVAQLGLALERAVAVARPRGHRVAERDRAPAPPGRGTCAGPRRAGRQAAQRNRVLAAQGARGDADDDERHERPSRRWRSAGAQPEAVDAGRWHRDGDEHGAWSTRRRRAGTPSPTGMPRCRRRCATSACEPGAPLLEQLLGAHPRHPPSGGLGGGQQERGGDADAARRRRVRSITADHQAGGHARGRRGRSAAAGAAARTSRAPRRVPRGRKPSRCRIPCVVSSRSSSSVGVTRRRWPAWRRRDGQSTMSPSTPSSGSSPSRPGRSSSIGKLMTSVGPGQVHPLHVEDLHRGLVDEARCTGRPAGGPASPP